jgi:hypothetical protein
VANLLARPSQVRYEKQWLHLKSGYQAADGLTMVLIRMLQKAMAPPEIWILPVVTVLLGKCDKTQ